MADEQGSHSVDYARRLFANVLDWYKNADSKAQILLTIDGAFLSFLTGKVFVRREEIASIFQSFGPETWSALVLMALMLTLSIVAALSCLWSRVRFSDGPQQQLSHATSAAEDPAPYPAELIWFFGKIAGLDESRFVRRMHEVTPADEIAALASQVHALSKNVLNKHRRVNLGFVLTGLSLIFFLAAGASYLARV